MLRFLPLLAMVLSVHLGLLVAVPGGAAADQRVVLEPTEMRHEIGLAWYVLLPSGWETTADDVHHPQRSGAVLLENGRPLGPAHSIHATIRERGSGGYSHWSTALYFSTSDGSDPRTNGREYVLETEPARATTGRNPAQSRGDGLGAGPGATTRE